MGGASSLAGSLPRRGGSSRHAGEAEDGPEDPRRSQAGARADPRRGHHIFGAVHDHVGLRPAVSRPLPSPPLPSPHRSSPVAEETADASIAAAHDLAGLLETRGCIASPDLRAAVAMGPRACGGGRCVRRSVPVRAGRRAGLRSASATSLTLSHPERAGRRKGADPPEGRAAGLRRAGDRGRRGWGRRRVLRRGPQRR